ncbi:MAG: hypothetical protein COY38_00785 [Candidatus Aenigmarchaeota archaeon CG_4_10_14_0_8_um_filter_37_24]|nr:hypothetical protein [Candidatus Aenigmarchaeota archaeon]PIV69064.1 MAG: hypothetical protein COS07_02050 [Candidatus Aenigmarchaeota archaeon CG01_land_8_20_14_3_00_37_9]PIW41330.1 MAG: hypothetical protein COW21_02370 [Candidatus Aenigmarchaeota archaeon CG15_BIG_FIL_POST_REV_8_21_14_020_37_27]PIX50698.1 MAG: hypothetical protein COZ52_02825 [Candidatus Aenigmarchaeota archaeon CG_4_8_14_3_um_filter_37_24]PIY36098.1 MAG: hypothetical protein COZ04_01445 [Candidatus Aenigmarchaeota archaeo
MHRVRCGLGSLAQYSNLRENLYFGRLIHGAALEIFIEARPDGTENTIAEYLTRNGFCHGCLFSGNELTPEALDTLRDIPLQ